MGLTWDIAFVRTPQGLSMIAQTFFSIVGGIVNIFSLGIATGLLAFAFWSSAIVSGVLLLLHICNVAQMIEAKIPYFAKIELGYVVIWIIVYVVCCILSFISFAISAIFAYIVIVALAVDAFFKYRNFRTATGAGPSTAESGNVK